MNRDSLVNEVASSLQLPMHRVRGVLNGFLSEVTEAMLRNERVNLHRFGAFNVKVRKARTARDLNNNVELRLNDCHIPHFMPFDKLKDIVAQLSPVSGEQAGPVAGDPVKQPVEETPRERTDDISAMLGRAEILANKGKIEQAIRLYRRILERQPRNATATGRLGRMFFRLDARETALEHYNRALGNDPGHLDTLVYRAELLVEQGRYEDARTDLLRVLEYDSDSYQACYLLGVLYITIGTYDAAIRMLSRALDADRTKAEVHHQLGKAYCHVEMHTEAIEHFEALLRHDPRNEQAYRYLGMIYDKNKKTDKALEMYRKSNEISLA